MSVQMPCGTPVGSMQACSLYPVPRGEKEMQRILLILNLLGEMGWLVALPTRNSEELAFE